MYLTYIKSLTLTPSWPTSTGEETDSKSLLSHPELMLKSVIIIRYPRLYSHLKGREEVHSQVCLTSTLCSVVYLSAFEWLNGCWDAKFKDSHHLCIAPCMVWICTQRCGLYWSSAGFGTRFIWVQTPNPPILVAVCSWSRFLASLNLSFLICKVEIMVLIVDDLK